MKKTKMFLLLVIASLIGIQAGDSINILDLPEKISIQQEGSGQGDGEDDGDFEVA